MDGTQSRRSRAKMQAIVPRTGGKNLLKNTIVKLIPEHKTFVELFVGGGGVFFAHPKSEKEVVNDLDKDIFDIYRDTKAVGDKMKGRKFTPNREKFWRLHDQKNFKSNTERLYRNLYLSIVSFGGTRMSYIGPKKEKAILEGKYPGSILPVKWQNDQFKERLKDVTILNQDFRNVIKKYDSKDTFFYLDPPYSRADKNKDYIHTGVTADDVFNAVKNIKGKFLMSYDNTPEAKKIFKNFNIMKVPTAYHSGNPKDRPGGVSKKVCELLISNYNVNSSNIKKCGDGAT